MLWDGTLPIDEKLQACDGPPRSLSHHWKPFFQLVWQTAHTFLRKGGLFIMKRFSTREMVYISLLISLNIILTRIASIRIAVGGVEIAKLGFGGFPIIFAGITMGPFAGGIVGAIGDIIGYHITPVGGYMPHFTLSAALTGIIPGLMLSPFKKGNYTFWQLSLAIGVGQIITSILMVPYFLEILFKVPRAITLPGRIIEQVISIPLYALITEIIMKRVPSALRTN